jgi:transcription elongation factor
MAIAKWAAPSARSSNIAGTTLNSLANGSESTVVTYDNSTALDLYSVVTIKLGSITPATGGSITLRVTLSDGTDTADRIGGDLYVVPLTSGAGAKVAVINMVRLYPFSMRLSVVNNAGVTLAASGNELYVCPWNEDIA